MNAKKFRELILFLKNETNNDLINRLSDDEITFEDFLKQIIPLNKIKSSQL